MNGTAGKTDTGYKTEILSMLVPDAKSNPGNDGNANIRCVL